MTTSNSSSRQAYSSHASIDDTIMHKDPTSHSYQELAEIKPEQLDQNNETFTPESSTGSRRKSSSESSASTPPVRTQSAFISKLYKILEDREIHHLISWTADGDMFSVSNPAVFSKEVLPQYFKHNNWQSFVRQLNMYGFHKVNDIIHSNLTSESQKWEFRHEHFRRGAIDALQNIKRKSAKSHHHYPQAYVTAAAAAAAAIPNATSVGPPPGVSSALHPLTHPVPSSRHGLHVQTNNRDSPMQLDNVPPLHHLESQMYHLSQAYQHLRHETEELRTYVDNQQHTIKNLTNLLLVLTKDNDRFHSYGKGLTGELTTRQIHSAFSHPSPHNEQSPSQQTMHPTFPPPPSPLHSHPPPTPPNRMGTNDRRLSLFDPPSVARASRGSASSATGNGLDLPPPTLPASSSSSSSSGPSSSLGPPLTMFIDKCIPDSSSSSSSRLPFEMDANEKEYKRRRYSP